ncbi:unnamed protein product [Gongylonema pulchrum]|uniref:cyclin-dependent kinase n=1 Tax=Gongylonema pulchrum TaxID=637853 RepID=A0A183E7S8_9BILA|nr:unnamed protein product [Gongylonema pulchrum]
MAELCTIVPGTIKDESAQFLLQNYLRLEKIGEGSYGIVYKAIDKRTGKFVAMKKIGIGKYEGIPQTTLREITVLKNLKHPNIVSLENLIWENNRIYMVFEYLPTDLKKFLREIGSSELLSKMQQKLFLYQLLQGIRFCHGRGILHRDLKPENLLIDEKGALKIADFGLARAVGDPGRVYSQEVLTLWYRSPEVLLGSNRYSKAVDIWSVGCIFAELATTKPLFAGDSEIDQLFQIFRILSTPTEDIWPGVGSLPSFKNVFPCWTEDTLDDVLEGYMDAKGIEILRQMLAYNPEERVSAKRLLKDAYFANINRSKLPGGKL